MIPRPTVAFLALLLCPLLATEPPHLDRYSDPPPPGALASSELPLRLPVS